MTNPTKPKGTNEMTNPTTNRRNLTDRLIADCTPCKSFYVGEYATYIRCIIENIEKSLGKPLTAKQLYRVLETI